MGLDGHRFLTLDDFKTNEGIGKLNEMLQLLFENAPGDGSTVKVYKGLGSPEGTVAAGIGSIYQRLDGGATSSIYVKESGTGATGWTAK